MHTRSRVGLVCVGLLLTGAWSGTCRAEPADPGAREREFARAREQLVRRHIAGRDITNPRVIKAFREVPRHRFIPADSHRQAYSDWPLPIGYDQTISQPYVAATMTEAAKVTPPCKVLEVGTGSGYQAAILAAVGCQVYSIEIVLPLCQQAAERLTQLGYTSVHVRCGDGYLGWPEHAPFDAVLITAAAPRVPEPLLEQLKPGGRLVVPLGDDGGQDLVVVRKSKDGKFVTREIYPVTFVPMTGKVRTPTKSK